MIHSGEQNWVVVSISFSSPQLIASAENGQASAGESMSVRSDATGSVPMPDEHFLTSHVSDQSIQQHRRAFRVHFFLSCAEGKYLLKTYSLSQIEEEERETHRSFCSSAKLVVLPFLLNCFKMKKFTRTYSAYASLYQRDDFRFPSRHRYSRSNADSRPQIASFF